ncbi:MAG: M48 family metalloprotease [Solirubrobacterales bacterium]
MNARPSYSRLNWLAFGALDRYDRGVWAAAIAAWTGLPFALWLAAFGGLIGAVLGLIGAHDSSLAREFHIGEGVGVLGIFAGLILGVIFGFLNIFIGYVNAPLDFIGAILSGFLVGSITLAILIAAEPQLMKLRGYRELSRREKDFLHPLLLDAGAGFGLRVVPELWISDKLIPGAWSHPRGIVIARGLLGDYDKSEGQPKPQLDSTAIRAILAHELVHWHFADPVGTRAVWSCCWPIVVAFNAASWLVQRNSGILKAVGWFFFWPAWVSIKLVIVPIMAKQSRSHEYEADARAANLGDDYRLGLRKALTELQDWEKPRTGWEDALEATHPPIELRLERLEAPRDAEAAIEPAQLLEGVEEVEVERAPAPEPLAPLTPAAPEPIQATERTVEPPSPTPPPVSQPPRSWPPQRTALTGTQQQATKPAKAPVRKVTVTEVAEGLAEKEKRRDTKKRQETPATARKRTSAKAPAQQPKASRTSPKPRSTKSQAPSESDAALRWLGSAERGESSDKATPDSTRRRPKKPPSA